MVRFLFASAGHLPGPFLPVPAVSGKPVFHFQAADTFEFVGIVGPDHGGGTGVFMSSM